MVDFIAYFQRLAKEICSCLCFYLISIYVVFYIQLLRFTQFLMSENIFFFEGFSQFFTF